MSNFTNEELICRLYATQLESHGWELLRNQVQRPLTLINDISELKEDDSVDSWQWDCCNKIVAVYNTSRAKPSTRSKILETAYRAWHSSRYAFPANRNFLVKMIELHRPAEGVQVDWRNRSRYPIFPMNTAEVAEFHSKLCERHAALRAHSLNGDEKERWLAMDMNPIFENLALVIQRGLEEEDEPRVHLVRTGKSCDLRLEHDLDELISSISNGDAMPIEQALQHIVRIDAARLEQSIGSMKSEEVAKHVANLSRFEDNPHERLRKLGYEYDGPTIVPVLLLQCRDRDLFPRSLFATMRWKCPGRLYDSPQDGLPFRTRQDASNRLAQ